MIDVQTLDSLPQFDMDQFPRNVGPEEINLEKGNVISVTPLAKSEAGRNSSLFVTLDNQMSGIFKPVSGEVELRKPGVVPGSYFKRERAAYLIDQDLGFNLVPPTVIRSIEGETGSLQMFVENATVAALLKDTNLPEADLMKMWLFDLIIRNTDRHKGNFLVSQDHVVAIDQGAAFGTSSAITYKDFLGRQVPQEIHRNIAHFTDSLNDGSFDAEYADLLTESDMRGLKRRSNTIKNLLNTHNMIPRVARRDVYLL